MRLTRFANDCLEVQLQANCRERDVYIIQPLVPPVQENLVELLLMADAARGASAARVTAVMSHYAYARSDKKDAAAHLHRRPPGRRPARHRGRQPGAHADPALARGARLLLRAGGPPARAARDRRALPRRDLSRTVVLSPDLGYAKSAAAFARRLGVPVAAGAKERFSD